MMNYTLDQIKSDAPADTSIASVCDQVHVQ